MIERKKDRLRKIQEKTHNKAKKRERNMKREREREREENNGKWSE